MSLKVIVTTSTIVIHYSPILEIGTDHRWAKDAGAALVVRSFSSRPMSSCRDIEGSVAAVGR